MLRVYLLCASIVVTRTALTQTGPDPTPGSALCWQGDLGKSPACSKPQHPGLFSAHNAGTATQGGPGCRMQDAFQVSEAWEVAINLSYSACSTTWRPQDNKSAVSWSTRLLSTLFFWRWGNNRAEKNPIRQRSPGTGLNEYSSLTSFLTFPI